MTALLDSAAHRELERAYAAKSPRASLMQRAGTAAARAAARLAGKKKSAAILVLAGPGNNGGDAWVCAAALAKAGHKVTVVPTGDAAPADPAARAAKAAVARGRDRIASRVPAKARYDVVVDGLLGIGLSRAPAGLIADLIRRANELGAAGTPVLALDVPSGLAADTGATPGDAIVATHTLTFLAHKPGLYTAAGRDHAGEVTLDTLGVATPEAPGRLLAQDAMQALIPVRRHRSHKGTHGSVGILGGAPGMAGAAVLAARAALYMGPGKVYLGMAAKDVPAFDPLNPEVMLRPAEEVLAIDALDALAIGMGLGTDRAAPRLLHAAMSRGLPTVLDADALNLLAANPSIGAPFQAKMAQEPRQCLSLVITPHPGEAARLLDTTVSLVEADRVDAARALARRWNAVAVLKGSGTIVATPDGRYAVNTTGNPGMASGGMGDALSGMIAALLAQGLAAENAACLAVYLHGLAADACVSHGMAPHGLTASEVIFEARALLNAGLEHHHDH